ncbi:hypothetical protein P5V15_011953 [Pogonomyrmex californicus]
MSPSSDFKGIKIFDDTTDNMNIIKSLIDIEEREAGFYIMDIGDIINKHREWITKIPRVVPHYAVKCNPDPNIIKLLVALNTSFDCASEQEIRQVMQYGVQADRIIFANPYKCPSHIKYAKKMNVSQMTADCELELLKIKEFYPEAKIIIRIRCDSKNSECDLGLKFGCEPDEEAVRLIRLTLDLGLTLHGFSFHVGSPCGELYSYSRGIGICRRLIIIAKSMGCKDVQLIDIGGGIPGEKGTNIDKPVNDEKFISTLWGPTCDSMDVIVKDVLMPELHIGDWLVWEDVGAYTLCMATTFNGFPTPAVIPIVRKSQWKSLMTDIEMLQKPKELIQWSKSMKREDYIESR